MEDDSTALDRVIAAAQAGDVASRNELLRTIRLRVLRYLLARGLPDHDAEDVAQETCLGLLNALPSWRDAGRPIWAMVFTILHNKIADRARRGAARRDVPVDDETFLADIAADPGPGPYQLIEEDDGAARVRALLAQLPATQRDVLLLRVIVGLSTAETAEALRLTVGSVRVLQHRAVAALRAKLNTVPEGAP